MAFDLIVEVPDRSGGTDPASLRVAGVPVLARLVRGARRAGARSVTIRGPGLDAVRERVKGDGIFAGAEVRWEDSDTDQPRAVPHGTVHARADVVVGARVWEMLAAADGAVRVPGAPLMERVGGGTPEPLWTGEAPWGAYVTPVRSKADARTAKRAIFDHVTKPTSGPVSRLVNARFSVPASKVLCELGVTPNQMTVFTTLVGIASAFFLARGSLWDLAAGGFLFQLAAVLDRVDGELARSTVTFSKRGEWIDTIGDNLTYLAVVIGLNVGYYRFELVRRSPVVEWIPEVGASVFLLGTTVIGGMAWYLRATGERGTMTAVQRDMSRRLDGVDVGWVYRSLDSLKVLGKRDSFSLIAFVLATLPLLAGWSGGFHFLVGAVDALIVLTAIYYLVGMIEVGRLASDAR